MSKQNIISTIQSKNVKKYLNLHGIKHISLFWSYAEWSENNKSDIDLLYEKYADKDIWIEFFAIVNYLQRKLWKKIDLIEEKYLNKHIKNYILKNKIDIL